MTDKTDKIRERLEALRFRAEKYEHGATTFDVDRLLEALEAVVEECTEVRDVDVDYQFSGTGSPVTVVDRSINRDKILDIIADELDVEEG